MTSTSIHRQIVEFADDAIVCIDAAQRITLFNDAAERMFGYVAREVLGQSIDVLLPSGVASLHAHLVSGFARNGRLCSRMNDRGAITGRRRCGAEFPAQASISVVRLGGEDIYTAILRDLSDGEGNLA